MTQPVSYIVALSDMRSEGLIIKSYYITIGNVSDGCLIVWIHACLSVELMSSLDKLIFHVRHVRNDSLSVLLVQNRPFSCHC